MLIDEQLRAFLDAQLDIASYLVAMHARNQRTHLRAGYRAIGDLELRNALLHARKQSIGRAFPTATATEMAMQRSPAEPKAAPVSASAAWSISASGITIMWFFAPPSACTRLPLRCRGGRRTPQSAWSRQS